MSNLLDRSVRPGDRIDTSALDAETVMSLAEDMDVEEDGFALVEQESEGKALIVYDNDKITVDEVNSMVDEFKIPLTIGVSDGTHIAHQISHPETQVVLYKHDGRSINHPSTTITVKEEPMDLAPVSGVKRGHAPLETITKKTSASSVKRLPKKTKFIKQEPKGSLDQRAVVPYADKRGRKRPLGDSEVQYFAKKPLGIRKKKIPKGQSWKYLGPSDAEAKRTEKRAKHGTRVIKGNIGKRGGHSSALTIPGTVEDEVLTTANTSEALTSQAGTGSVNVLEGAEAPLKLLREFALDLESGPAYDAVGGVIQTLERIKKRESQGDFLEIEEIDRRKLKRRKKRGVFPKRKKRTKRKR